MCAEEGLNEVDRGPAANLIDMGRGRLGTPDAGRAVDAAGADLAAVAADRQADDAAGVPPERENIVARIRIPELDGSIVAGGGQAAAVGKESHGGHQAGGPIGEGNEAA